MHASGIQRRVFQVRKVSTRALEGRELLMLDFRSPREGRAPRVDMRIGKPRLGGGDQTIRNQDAMIAGEMTDDHRIPYAVFPRQRKRIRRKLIRVGNVQRGRQRRFLPDLIWSNYLGDFQHLGLIGVQISERDRTVSCAKVDAKTKTGGHELKSRLHCGGRRKLVGPSPAGETIKSLAQFGRRRTRGHDACVVRRLLVAAYFSSISAGAIVGIRPALTRTKRGSFIDSVFQPRWTSVPENGPAPLILPINRYSSAAYPRATVTADPSLSSRKGLIARCSCRTALHPPCTTRAAAPTWASL